MIENAAQCFFISRDFSWLGFCGPCLYTSTFSHSLLRFPQMRGSGKISPHSRLTPLFLTFSFILNLGLGQKCSVGLVSSPQGQGHPFTPYREFKQEKYVKKKGARARLSLKYNAPYFFGILIFFFFPFCLFCYFYIKNLIIQINRNLLKF